MIITVNNLSKIYTTYKRGSSFKETITSFFHREKVEVRAVDDISFTVEKGSITGILGPNGAGKSTTIKMLTGVLYPSNGSIDVMGYSPAKMRKKYVMHIGAVFGQKSQLIWDIPPVDSFNMNRAIYGISKEDYNKRLDMFCSMFDIGDVMKKPTRVLSLGERMKCEFVMALLHNPEIVFLDEPTIGLDVIAKQKIRDFIRDMNKTGTTFILTTHDLDDIEQLAEKVIIINHGKKVFDDSIENLQNALGAKKVVALTLSKPFTDVNMPGVSVISKENDMEVTLEIDTAVTSIDSFIRNASDVFHFTDIAVKPLPMEKIITKIYTDKETSK